MKLVPAWRKSYKFYSNWAHMAQASILIAWAHMPADMKTGLTPWMLTGISVVTFLAGFTGSITSQDGGKTNDQ